MKCKKWTANRNAPSSRLIVDEYDLIQKESKQQHAICKFCQQHIPQRLIVSHKNVCIMAENNEYYAGSKVESEQLQPRELRQENNRKKIGSKLKKKLRRTSSNASIHKNHKSKKPQPMEFCNNPSLFSQKSNRKSNKKPNHSSTYQKCNSVRKLSTKYEKKPLLTNQSVHLHLSKSKGSEQDKLKKKPKQVKESYYEQQFRKGLSKKGKKMERKQLPSKMEIKDKRYEKQRQMKREKEREQEKRRRQRQRQKEIERERERERERRRQEERRNQQTQRRAHNSGYRRRNNRNQQSQNRRPRNIHREEFFDEQSFEEEFSNYPHQTFNFITQTMNEQFQMMRQQFQNMSQFFNNFQGFQANNGFVFYHSNVSDSSEGTVYYEEESGEEEEQGLTQQEIQIIPKFRYKKRNGIDQQCTVCLNTLKGNEIVRGLPCQHVFHCECIDEWLQRKAACPVCRENIKNLLL